MVSDGLNSSESSVVTRLLAKLPNTKHLSGRLLILTIVFVMLAEILIYVPSIAKFRRDWLSDRLEDAQLASLAIQTTQTLEIPQMLEDELLRNAGVLQVAQRRDQKRELILSGDDMIMAEAMFDLRKANPFTLIADAISTTFAPSNRVIAVRGAPTYADGELIEIILNERKLRQAMITYSRNILLLSLGISVLTGLLVFVALHRTLVQPMTRLTASMTHFSAKPEDASRIIDPSSDIVEIQAAESHLATMQREVRNSLQQKSRLAALGTAVSKINHDLRNILASAQLLSERLALSDDPNIQKMAPRLVNSIDRAVDLAKQTLQYGKAEEALPQKRSVVLKDVVADVFTEVQTTEKADIDWQTDISDEFVVEADSDQLFRILLNIVRNSVQAIVAEPNTGPNCVKISARDGEEGGLKAQIIDLEDSGPGIPEKAREYLFEAFTGSLRKGGTGLGLAISHELVEAHGGDLKLVKSDSGGTHFRIVLPAKEERA